VEEGKSNDEGNWVHRKTTDIIKVWTRYQGTEMNPSIPCLKVEHYFPNVKDPEEVLKAYNEQRPIWDRSMDVCEELPEFKNENTIVHRLVNRSVFGMSKREFIDKKIFFRRGNELYVWVSFCPDDSYECKPPHIRSYSIMGFNKIGVLPSGGCYLHCISQTDLKVPNWLLNSIISLIPAQMIDWGNMCRKYIDEKYNE